MMLNKEKIIGKIIFLVGLPGSGKTTIAKKIKKILYFKKISCLHLDGDDLREALNNNKYSKKERIKLSITYLRLSEMLLKQTNVILLSSVSLYNQVENFLKIKDILKLTLSKNFENRDKIKIKIRKKFIKSIKFDIPKNQ